MTPEADPGKALTKNPLGPTGQTVATNIERLRVDQNLTFAALSEKLAAIGRPIPTLGLRKIVGQTRRVDADDLMALAVALGVTPITLMIPDGVDRHAEVDVTGLPRPYAAEYFWEWLTARDPLHNAPRQAFDFYAKAWPAWYQERNRSVIDAVDVEQSGLHTRPAE